MEMQHKAAKLGLRVMEIDVPYRKRRAGRSKISGTIVGSVRAGWKILSTIGLCWWAMRGSRVGPIKKTHTPATTIASAD